MKETAENGQELYSVSETVQKTGVPSHVLRYWEDELHLLIRRSEQGYRLYSRENIATFRRVKELKEKGIQLKAIRLLLEDSEDRKRLEQLLGQEPEAVQSPEWTAKETAEPQEQDRIRQTWETGAEHSGCAGQTEKANAARRLRDVEYEIIPTAEAGNYQRFEAMMRGLICEAVAEQNEKLEQDLTDLLRDEFEDFYIQLRQEAAKREAAVSRMRSAPASASVKKGVFQKLMEVVKERHFFY